MQKNQKPPLAIALTKHRWDGVLILTALLVILAFHRRDMITKALWVLLQSPIRGEKSGLDDSYLRTWFLENEFKPNEKLDFLARVVYRETGTSRRFLHIYYTDGTKLIRVPITSYSNRIEGDVTANY